MEPRVAAVVMCPLHTCRPFVNQPEDRLRVMRPSSGSCYRRLELAEDKHQQADVSNGHARGLRGLVMQSRLLVE